MACCGLPHDDRITCEEIAWAVAAPTEREAFKRAMVIAERINGAPVGNKLRHRLSFREQVRLLGRQHDKN